MNRTAALSIVALSLAWALPDARAATAVASAAPAAAAASQPARAPSGVHTAPTRGAALPVGAETLPAEWLEAVEPGLSKATHAAPPLATPTQVVTRPATR